jgi:DNA polymerase-3 subunit epsilon
MRSHRLPSRIVAIDVETTGLSPTRGHRVIEIGAVAIEGGSIIEEFHSLIFSGRRISLAARNVHGISDEMLIGQPAPEVVFPHFHQFISGSIVVAHNAEFDMAFIRQEFYRLGLSMNCPFVCTLHLGRRFCRGLSNYRLETVARHLLGRLPCDRQRHRALDDARIVAQVWLALGKR